eukprot:TRINITY_DN3134_c2_g1_i1.p1 TRINITY_DN3134_c2_g1~~TRINITY_DN3134_c2_g1_i1.p1  ORF type:complete len:444 (+),score=134.16 TRINITY_DN3134_c2_g1_i1:189-1334(+)
MAEQNFSALLPPAAGRAPHDQQLRLVKDLRAGRWKVERRRRRYKEPPARVQTRSGGGDGQVTVLSPQYGKLRAPAAALSPRRIRHQPHPPRNNLVLGNLPPLRPEPPRRHLGALEEVVTEVEAFEQRLLVRGSGAKDTGRQPVSLSMRSRQLRIARRLPTSRVAQVVRLRHDYLAALLRATSLQDIREGFLGQQGSGLQSLDQPAMASLLRALVPRFPLSNQQAQELFHVFDVDGSGRVSFTEFFGTVGSIIADPDIERGLRFFWLQFETDKGVIPVGRVTAANVALFAKHCLPVGLRHRWVCVGREMELALRDHPDDCIRSTQELRAVVYASPGLSRCFHGLLPQEPRRPSVEAIDDDSAASPPAPVSTSSSPQPPAASG